MYILTLIFISASVFITGYFIGRWHGIRRCMIEHHILFGKDADEFERRARENEEKAGIFIPRESEVDRCYRIHHGVSYKTFVEKITNKIFKKKK